jgi:hypothetical protein
MSISSGSGGGWVPGSRSDRKEEGATKAIFQHHPPNLPPLGGGGERAGTEEMLPHSKGCDSWTSGPAPAPRGCPAGDPEAQDGDAFPDSHGRAFLPLPRSRQVKGVHPRPVPRG